MAINGTLDLVHAERPGDDERSRLQIDALAGSLAIPAERRHLIPGEPSQSLAEFAHRQRYDLVALGALNHSGGTSSLVGTLTDRLINALHSDFLLLKPESFSCPVQLPAS
jgi:universal stress protein E